MISVPSSPCADVETFRGVFPGKFGLALLLHVSSQASIDLLLVQTDHRPLQVWTYALVSSLSLFDVLHSLSLVELAQMNLRFMD